MADNKEKLMKFVSWVRETKMPEASPEEVVQQIQIMSQDPQGQQELQMWTQEFEEEDAGSQMFKKGGKLDKLVEKRKVAKAKDGVKTSTKKPQVSREEDSPYANQKYIEQEYWKDPNSNHTYVHVTTAPTRELLISNQRKDPNSAFNFYKGDYEGPHLSLSGNETGIEGIWDGVGGQAQRLHDADSVSALNQIVELAKRAGFKLGFPLQKSKI